MAKALFGDYTAFEARGGVRFMKTNKLVAESSVPPEVVGYLKKSLNFVDVPKEPPRQRFPRPSDEEIARVRVESLQVPVELQVPLESVAPLEPFAPEVKVVEEPLTPDDFLIEEPEFNKEPLPLDSDFLESVSIHTAPLQDIAEALYNRFGIYTVYLGKLPVTDEINPLTGEVFTKYHQGIAYQASIRAQSIGLLNKPAETGRMQLDEGRYASEHFQVDAAPTTLADARRADSFDYRTSPQATRSIARTEIIHEADTSGIVRAVQIDIPEGQTGQFNGASARYDADEDDLLVQPNIGGRPIVRPNW